MAEPIRMFGVRLPESLIRRFRAYAALQGRSAQDVARQLIETAVKIPATPAVPRRRKARKVRQVKTSE